MKQGDVLIASIQSVVSDADLLHLQDELVRQAGKIRARGVDVITSSKGERDLIQSYQLGVKSYIQKPVDFDQFQTTVEQLGLYWLLVNQPPPINAFATMRPDPPR